MKINKNLILVGAVFGASLLLTGCGAKGQQFTSFEQPAKGKGKVYVYRPDSFVGGGVYYDVHNAAENEKVVGTLRNGGFISFDTKPGEVLLWAKTEARNDVMVDVKENEIVCVKGGVGMGFFVGHPTLNNVHKKICESEIKDTKESIN